jgi:hypothetical protein
MTTTSSFSVVAQPGYVQLVIGSDAGTRGAKSACRQFAQVCREESATRALILLAAPGPAAEQLGDQLPLAMEAFSAGFRLAVVARRPVSKAVAATLANRGAGRGAIAKAFPSEHRAAVWLMN